MRAAISISPGAAGRNGVRRPAHVVEFGAQARSLDAPRASTASSARTTDGHAPAMPTCDTWSAAGWAQYRWTPSARFSITPGVRVERWDLIEQHQGVAVAAGRVRGASGHARAVRRRRAAPGADASISRCSCSRAPSCVPERVGHHRSRHRATDRLHVARGRIGVSPPRERPAAVRRCGDSRREQPRGPAAGIELAECARGRPPTASS